MNNVQKYILLAYDKYQRLLRSKVPSNEKETLGAEPPQEEEVEKLEEKEAKQEKKSDSYNPPPPGIPEHQTGFRWLSLNEASEK